MAIHVPRREATRGGPFTLLQNHPNPFRSETTIRYILHSPTHIQLKIVDIHGREIRTLVEAFQMAGEYDIQWQVDDLPGGVYFYQLQSGEYAENGKLIISQ